MLERYIGLALFYSKNKVSQGFFHERVADAFAQEFEFVVDWTRVRVVAMFETNAAALKNIQTINGRYHFEQGDVPGFAVQRKTAIGPFYRYEQFIFDKNLQDFAQKMSRNILVIGYFFQANFAIWSRVKRNVKYRLKSVFTGF